MLLEKSKGCQIVYFRGREVNCGVGWTEKGFFSLLQVLDNAFPGV